MLVSDPRMKVIAELFMTPFHTEPLSNSFHKIDMDVYMGRLWQI